MKTERFCSFCGKNAKELRTLIVLDNRSTFGICDKCVVECFEVLIFGTSSQKPVGLGMDFLDRVVARLRAVAPVIEKINATDARDEALAAEYRRLCTETPLFAEGERHEA